MLAHKTSYVVLLLIRLLLLPIAFIQLLLDVTVIRVCFAYVNISVGSSTDAKSQIISGIQNYLLITNSTFSTIISSILDAFE